MSRLVVAGNQAFTADTDAADVNLSLGGGYNVLFGSFSVTPFAQLAYLRSDIDGYTEKQQGDNTNPGFGLALAVDDQEITSLGTTLGFQLSQTINTTSGVVTPYLRLDWEHEFENDARDINARFAAVGGNTLNTIIIPTDDPDRDFFNFLSPSTLPLWFLCWSLEIGHLAGGCPCYFLAVWETFCLPRVSFPLIPQQAKFLKVPLKTGHILFLKILMPLQKRREQALKTQSRPPYIWQTSITLPLSTRCMPNILKNPSRRAVPSRWQHSPWEQM